MNRAEKAKALFLQGYNCSQSVVIAFADLLEIDENTLAKMVSGFGGGVGRMRETCGSVSGMVFVWSMLYGYDNADDFEGKKRLYEEIQLLCQQFIDKNRSIVCRELLGLNQNDKINPTPEKRTDGYYKKRPCAELVKISADILDNAINDKCNKK